MLLVIKQSRDIDFTQFMEVCKESNAEKGRQEYPGFSAYDQLRLAENELVDYMRESMQSGTLICAVWAPGGRYKAVLRLEQYLDGYLITGLVSSPQERRKGYAEALLCSVLTAFPNSIFYSHIKVSNLASISIHLKCGFTKVLDHALYLDGSISTFAATYCMKT